MSQWQRLPAKEAAEMVRMRDERRVEFLQTHFHRHGGDVHQYDMLLNTSLLGEEVCAELIVTAAESAIGAAGGVENGEKRLTSWGGRLTS